MVNQLYKGKVMDKIETMFSERVETALKHKFRCELANPNTGQPMSADERREFLTHAFVEIAKGMGIARFAETPVERLDQFAVMSVVKNHDTAGLLRSLVNSFMIAYGDPSTADRAFAALVQIEALRAEVADDRGQQTQNNVLSEALLALNELLKQQMPSHSITSPCYRILVGADRLFVMSPKPIKDLPEEINGVLVEGLIDDLVAKAQ